MRRLAPQSPSSPVAGSVARTLRRALGASLISLGIASPAFATVNVNKTFTPDAVKANQPSKVTFYFVNNSLSAATSLAFIDPLPTGMVVAPTPNAVTNCGGTLTATAGASSVSFSGGTIPAAVNTTPGQCDLSFDVVVASPSVLINTVPAGEVTSTQGSNLQDAEATLNVTGLAPISGTKQFSPAFVHGYLPLYSTPIPAGSKSTVTITLNNPNDVALTSVAFTDSLPSTPGTATGGIVVSPIPNESTTCGGTVTAVAGAKSVSLSGGTIPAFGSCNVKFDVVAESPTVNAQGNIRNQIPAGGVTTFEGPTNATFFADINRQTGGNVGKTFAGNGTIANGATTLLTITVRNYTQSVLNNIAFTDTLPGTAPNGLYIANPARPTLVSSDCEFPSAGASGFSVTADPDTKTITVSGGSLAAAPNSANPTQCTIRINVKGINPTATNMPLTNQILTGTWNATLGNFTYPTGTAGITILPTTLINGAKTFSPSAIYQGDSSVATITLKNDSGVQLTSFGFTDNVTTKMGGAPGSVSIAAAPAPTNDCGMTLDGTVLPNVLKFTGGTLAAGATCTVTFTVNTTANIATAGGRVNTIDANQVTGTTPTAEVIKNLLPISGTLVIVAPSAGKAFNPGTVMAGFDSLLTITVTRPNSASQTWANFTVTDNLPAGHTVSPVAATPAANACVGTITAPVGGSSIQFTSSAVPAQNSSCTIRVNVRTPTGSAGTALNRILPGQFVVNYVGGGSFSNTANLDANITRTTASVSLTKSFDPPVVDLLGTSKMFLRIVNTSGSAVNLTGVNLLDTLPVGLIVANPASPAFTGTGCSLGTLTATPGDNKVTLTNATVNAGRICSIEVNTQALAAGNLINQVPAGALTSTQLITNAEPVAATVTSTGLSHLTVTKTDGIASMRPDGTTTYTVVVANGTGPNIADVAGATFTDTPPTGMTFTSWSCAPSSGAVCTATGSGAISDTVTIPKGGSITYTINAKLAADYALATVQNCATIMPPGSVIDDDLTDNQACDTNDILRGLKLRKAWVNGITDDAIGVTTTGLANNATVASTSTGSNTTDGLQVLNLAGGTVTLPAETFAPGQQSNYTTTLSCDTVTPTSTTPPATFTMPNADVVCTYTNTRKQRQLTLKKVWVNGLNGDAISVTATGTTASVASTSTGNNTDTGQPVTVVPGTGVTLPAEQFTSGSQTSYTTTLSCDTVTPTSTTPPATFTMPENDVVCTYTNTLVTYTLTLKKTWSDGKNGDQISVTTTGAKNNASVTSTSTGNNTDTGTPASNVAGTVVTLPAETFGTGLQSDYTTTVSCTGASATSSTPGPNTTVTMPAGNVVCTYVNARKSIGIVANAVCINDTPYVNYTITPSGFTPGANPVTLEWVDSTNTVRETLTGQPLSGQILWTGTTVIGGVTVDWPGWAFVGGVWVVDNDGLVPTMTLRASVNPTTEILLNYPPATAKCIPPEIHKDPPPPTVSAVPVGGPEGLAVLAAMLALLGAWSARQRARKS